MYFFLICILYVVTSTQTSCLQDCLLRCSVSKAMDFYLYLSKAIRSSFHVYYEAFKYHMTVFWAILNPSLPIWRIKLHFCNQNDDFANPLPHMTALKRFEQTPSPAKRHMIFEPSLTSKLFAVLRRIWYIPATCWKSKFKLCRFAYCC